ncbi:MAG: hypothetical protein K0R75_4035 [Paenibacillaceae bacterium]|jgi:hypothetical protein|nr:hypothetical protein [Paenibacillaceae bacterium]
MISISSSLFRTEAPSIAEQSCSVSIGAFLLSVEERRGMMDQKVRIATALGLIALAFLAVGAVKVL